MLTVVWRDWNASVFSVSRPFPLVTTDITTASVAKWSEFLATDPDARVRFPVLPEKSSGLERSPLRLLSTTVELLYRKVTAPV
jgi:hypothetical protein